MFLGFSKIVQCIIIFHMQQLFLISALDDILHKEETSHNNVYLGIYNTVHKMNSYNFPLWCHKIKGMVEEQDVLNTLKLFWLILGQRKTSLSIFL